MLKTAVVCHALHRAEARETKLRAIEVERGELTQSHIVHLMIEQ